MAKIVEENIIIKISSIVKDGVEGNAHVTDELLATLETVVSEIVGNGVVVEVVAA